MPSPVREDGREEQRVPHGRRNDPRVADGLAGQRTSHGDHDDGIDEHRHDRKSRSEPPLTRSATREPMRPFRTFSSFFSKRRPTPSALHSSQVRSIHDPAARLIVSCRARGQEHDQGVGISGRRRRDADDVGVDDGKQCDGRSGPAGVRRGRDGCALRRCHFGGSQMFDPSLCLLAHRLPFPNHEPAKPNGSG